MPVSFVVLDYFTDFVEMAHFTVRGNDAVFNVNTPTPYGLLIFFDVWLSILRMHEPYILLCAAIGHHKVLARHTHHARIAVRTINQAIRGDIPGPETWSHVVGVLRGE
jgi:poly-beta-hydroxyalkanoate depolymerase